MAAALGVFNDGIIPGILTINNIADDVSKERLEFLTEHRNIGVKNIDATIINSKGFGGNNASASILAPHVAEKMLEQRHGKKVLGEYYKRHEEVAEATRQYDHSTTEGKNNVIYKFDHNVLGSEEIDISQNSISISKIEKEISLHLKNNYEDMCE